MAQGGDGTADQYLSWLLLIPRIGRTRAERLAAKFPSADALRAATAEEIAAVEGFGPVLASRVKEFVEKAESGGEFGSRGAEQGLYLCPKCGAMIAKDAGRCPSCGTVFEGEEAPEAQAPGPEAPATERLEREGQSLNLCPSCGAFVGADASVCPSCGSRLEGEEVAEAAGVHGEAPADRLEQEGQGLYLCPNCGALVGVGSAMCPKCGTSLEGEEVAPRAEAEDVAELPPEAISGQPSL
ncbi:MAG TPA: zinc ribbon domain-containing protein, partial [Thermoplasmata archaeon]|nr:zinc ribbon domain-containing protein [Thermoplasmata archaeon]